MTNETKFKRYIARHRWLLCVLGIFLFHAGFMIAWTHANPYSQKGIDVPNHLLFSLEFNDEFRVIWSGSQYNWMEQIAQTLDLFQTTNIYWPRLINLLSVPFVQLFGRSIFAIKLSNLLYLFILLLATYGIGKELRDERTGFWACVLVSLCPIIYQSLRQYGLDLPLTAFVVLAVYLLIRSRGLVRLWETAILGAVIGIGMLFKGQMAIFIFWPVAITVVPRIRQYWKSDRSTHKPWIGFDSRLPYYINRIVLLTIITATIASLHWLSSLILPVEALSELFTHATSDLKAGTGSFKGDTRSILSVLWHFAYLFGHSAGPAITFGWVMAVLTGLPRLKESETLRIIFTMTIIPLLIFSFLFMTKHGRYLMPIVPFMTISISWLLWGTPETVIKQFGKIAIVAYSIGTFLILSVGDLGGINIKELAKVNSGSLFPIFSLLPDTKYWDSILGNKDALGRKELYDKAVDSIVQSEKVLSPLEIGKIHMDRGMDYIPSSIYIKLKQKSIQVYDLIDKNRLFAVHSSRLHYLLFIYDIGYDKPWVSSSDLIKAYNRAGLAEETIAAVFASEAIPNLVSMKEDFVKIKQFTSDNTNTMVIVYKRLDK